MSKFKKGDSVLYRGTEQYVVSVDIKPRYNLHAPGSEPHRVDRGNVPESMISPVPRGSSREPAEDELVRVQRAILECERPCPSDKLCCSFSAARRAIAAMNPPAPLTAVTISDEELGERIAGYGVLPKCTRRNIAIDARELLCKNSVEVDFVVTTDGKSFLRDPISERAKRAYPERTTCPCLGDTAERVAELQHQGFTVLVR